MPDSGGVRGVGAIAAAAGVKTDHGMPAEFALPLGDLLARVPQSCVRAGRHDATRVVRIPAAEIAPGLARGRVEISIPRLAALAPDVFRGERGDLDDAPARLPLQKLLQQIRTESTQPIPPAVAPGAPEPALPALENLVGENARDGAGILAEAALPDTSENVDARDVAPFPAAEPSSAAAEPPVDFSREIPAQFSAQEAGAIGKIAPAPVAAPPFVPEVRATISVVATTAPDRRRELRPSQDVVTSSTLRAVILGGIAPAGAAGQILAPRAAPPPTATAPVIPGPSVVASPNDGGASPAHVSPDFAGLQSLFLSSAALDLESVTALAAALPGVRACVVSGSAGDATAGDFSIVSPEEMRAAMASLAPGGGSVTEILHRGENDLAIFRHETVCVAALVAAGGFIPGVRERLARVAVLLAGQPH